MQHSPLQFWVYSVQTTAIRHRQSAGAPIGHLGAR